MTAQSQQPPFNVLCLHGAHQDQEVFRYKTERVKAALEQTGCTSSSTTTGRSLLLHYMDAPLEIDLIHPDDTVRMRCWYTSTKSTEKEEDPIALFPGTISAAQAAVDPSGWTVSRKAILAFINSELGGHCDAILGFSQGCVAAMRFCLEEPSAFTTLGVKGLLLCGAPMLPLGEIESRQDIGFPATLRSLHVIGESDALVPAAESLQLADVCFTEPELLRHSAGHLVPHNPKQVAMMRSFMESLVPPEDTQESQDMVAMEVEGLQSMFETLTCQFDARTGQHRISVDVGNNDGIEGSVLVEVMLPPRYPEEKHGPRVQGVSGSYIKRISQDFSSGYLRWWAQLQVDMDDTLDSLVGSSSLFTLLQCIKDAADRLNDSIQSGVLKSNQHISAITAAQSEEEAKKIDPWEVADEDPVQREQFAREAQKWADTQLSDVRAKVMAAATTTAAGPSATSSSQSTVAPSASSLHTHREILYGGKKSHGQWKYCVGLVGKPSAGKSTFFNAVTDPDSQLEAAKVGAFPFTTIEPNVGRAFVGVPCPCGILFESSSFSTTTSGSGSTTAHRQACGAQYGHLPGTTQRRVPITVKDVAGLVPGAYQGQGKGNRFLNDLCDADILVHVVDGSGRSTAEGVSLEGITLTTTDGKNKEEEASTGSSSCKDASDPVKDITWIRDEIHHWVYDNLRKKWRMIVSSPNKLLGMFTGYHSNPTFVEELLESVMGVKMAQLGARLTLWGPLELHRLVAVFIAARFPIVLALNKSDAPTARSHWEQVRAAFPEAEKEGMLVRMAARVESELLKLRRNGIIEYRLGEVPSLAPNPPTPVPNEEGTSSSPSETIEQQQCFASKLIDFVANKNKTQSTTPGSATKGSTGVQEVLGAALARKPALYVYPVRDFSSFHSAVDEAAANTTTKAATAGAVGTTTVEASTAANTNSFAHCLLMHQGSTVEDCFRLLKDEVRCLTGKFVRCEGLILPSAKLNNCTTSSDSSSVAASPSIMRKEDTLNSGIAVLRIMTNKRSAN